MFNLSLKNFQSNIIQTDVYNTFVFAILWRWCHYMDSVLFGGKSSEHFANHKHDSNVSDFQNLKF